MNIVKDINDKIKLEVASVLTGFHELHFINNVELNDERTLTKGYGVRPLSAESIAGITCNYTLDQSFEIILTDYAPRSGESDEQVFESIFNLYDKVDECFNKLFLNQLGLTPNVMSVFNPSISEPEFFNENQFIVLRAQVDVKWRRQIF